MEGLLNLEIEFTASECVLRDCTEQGVDYSEYSCVFGKVVAPVMERT